MRNTEYGIAERNSMIIIIIKPRPRVVLLCLSAKFRQIIQGSKKKQTSNHTRIKSNNRLLLKHFCFNVMTIFVTHGRCLTTFR